MTNEGMSHNKYSVYYSSAGTLLLRTACSLALALGWPWVGPCMCGSIPATGYGQLEMGCTPGPPCCTLRITIGPAAVTSGTGADWCVLGEAVTW